MNLIKNNLFSFIALIIFLAVNYATCEKLRNSNTIVAGSDTVINNTYRKVDSTIVVKPVEIRYVPYDTSMKDTVYLPSQNYDELKQQFADIRKELLALRVYQKEYPIDTIGKIFIMDSVQKNEIVGRTIKYDFKIPQKVITVTNNIVPQPKPKLYFGFGLQGNKDKYVNQADFNFLLLNKGTTGYQIGAGYNFDKSINYRVGYYKQL